MGGGRQSKKGDSAALRRSLFGAGFIPGWLLALCFGPNPVGWRWRVSHSWGWMCCWQFCRRGESSKTRAGVLVLACLAACSAWYPLWECRAGFPAGLRSCGVLHRAVVGCRVDSVGGLLPSPQATDQPWGQPTWERLAGDAGSLNTSLVSAFTAGLDPLPGSTSPRGNGESVAETTLQPLRSCGRCVLKHPPPRWVLGPGSWLWRQHLPSAP